MAAEQQRPWGYTWIAVAIIAFVLAYTFIRLQYARPEPPSNPYEENEQVRGGPLAGPAAWTAVVVQAMPRAEGGDFAPLTLNYLPMAAGVPREFGVILPKDTVWPSVVEAVQFRRTAETLELRIDVAWPENARPPSGWFGFARAELTPEQAGGSSRLLSQIRSDLERSIFLTAHLLLMPDPASTAWNPVDAPRTLTLRLPGAALPSPAARLVIPTRRGLAFVELPPVQ